MWVRIICATLTLIAFVGAILFHYIYEETFVFNVCLAIFGSALLTYLNALISYKVTRREAIMRYLTDLRRYRRKFKNMQAASQDNRTPYLEDLCDFFYELHSDYSKIQYLRRRFFIHEYSYVLDYSFQNIADIQSELNCSQFNLMQQIVKVEEAADMVEELAKNKKYLHSPKKENDHGQP